MLVFDFLREGCHIDKQGLMTAGTRKVWVKVSWQRSDWSCQTASIAPVFWVAVFFSHVMLAYVVWFGLEVPAHQLRAWLSVAKSKQIAGCVILATHAVSMMPSPLLLLDLLDVVEAEAEAIEASDMICLFENNKTNVCYMCRCTCVSSSLHPLSCRLLLWRVHRDMLVGCLILLMYSFTCAHTQGGECQHLEELTPIGARDASETVWATLAKCPIYLSCGMRSLRMGMWSESA